MHLCTDDGTMQFSALLFDQTLATTIFFSFIPFILILMMGRHIMAQTNRFLMFYYTRHYQESSLSQKVTLLILLRLHRVGKSVTYLICSSRLE